MVEAAKQFVAGEIHFSALVQPITVCEYWSRTRGINTEVHQLAEEWQELVDRTWNEYGQHENPLTIEELRLHIQNDLGEI